LPVSASLGVLLLGTYLILLRPSLFTLLD